MKLRIPDSLAFRGSSLPRSITTAGIERIPELERIAAEASAKVAKSLQAEAEIVGDFHDLVERADSYTNRLRRGESEAASTAQLLKQRLADLRGAFGGGQNATGTGERVQDIALAERSLELIQQELEHLRAEAKAAVADIEAFCKKHKIAPDFIPTLETPTASD